MPAFKVETTMVSDMDMKTSESLPMDFDSTNQSATLVVMDEQEFLPPSDPIPIDVDGQLTAFSAVTAASEESLLGSAEPEVESAVLEVESVNERKMTPLEAGSEHSSATHISVDVNPTKVDLSEVMSSAFNDSMDVESPEVLLSRPSDPSSRDVFEEISAFSSTTTATEAVHRNESLPAIPVSDQSDNDSDVPTSLSTDFLPLATTEVESSLPAMDSSGATSISQELVDLIEEAQILTEQDRVSLSIAGISSLFQYALMKSPLTLVFALVRRG
jgi:hypothetical protein